METVQSRRQRADRESGTPDASHSHEKPLDVVHVMYKIYDIRVIGGVWYAAPQARMPLNYSKWDQLEVCLSPLPLLSLCNYFPYRSLTTLILRVTRTLTKNHLFGPSLFPSCLEIDFPSHRTAGGSNAISTRSGRRAIIASNNSVLRSRVTMYSSLAFALSNLSSLSRAHLTSRLR
jgi:hypothetical protein